MSSTKPNIKPVVEPTNGRVEPYKPGKTKAKKAARSVGRGLGLFVSALAAAGEAAAARDAEARQIDLEIRTLQEKQANLYGLSLRPSPASYRVQWSQVRPAHLLNCTTNCSSKHCLDCGDTISNYRVRCWNCG
jgi:hypothetical protein